MKTSDELIIIEQSFNSSVESVWNSITEIGQMRKWYFENIPDFKPEVGFETQFNVRSIEKSFLHIWKVTEVQPLKKIKYIWSFQNYLGASSTTFELFKEDKITKLKLTVDVLQDFPDEIIEFTRENCIGGWVYFINNRLKDFLDNG